MRSIIIKMIEVIGKKRVDSVDYYQILKDGQMLGAQVMSISDVLTYDETIL